MRVVAVLVLLVASGGAGGCASHAGSTLPGSPGLSNLGRVDDGLWRCAQPTAEGFRSAQALGVRTVIDLRASHTDAPLLSGTSLREVNLPMHQASVTEADLVAFLVVATDPAARPVLVHCAQGRDRTGICVAAYRRVVDGWSLEQARSEMRAYGAMPWWVNLDRLLRRLDPKRLREGVNAARSGRRIDVPCAPRTPSVSPPASASSS